MKKSIVLLTVLITGCANTPYARLDVGYKMHQTETRGISCDSNITVRVELGVMYKGYVAGVNHQSQPMCGWPVDNRAEIVIDQIFAGKIWTF